MDRELRYISLLKMGIFQPAMLVWRVSSLKFCPKGPFSIPAKVDRKSLIRPFVSVFVNIKMLNGQECLKLSALLIAPFFFCDIWQPLC